MGGLRRRWLIILALAGVIVAGSFYDHWRKAVPPEMPAPAAQAVPAAGARPAVHVSGAVNKPGVYEVGPGSRVVDAVNAAGGLAAEADAARVNLAQPVKDGMHVHVPAAGQASSVRSGTADRAAPAPGNGKVSINAADRGEFESLPGIGPVLAERIIEYRRANGPFRDVTELKKVNGIGEVKFDRIKDRITL